MDRLDDAKELFLKFGGNYYFMDHEGEYEHYKTYGIGKEQETKWAREAELFWLKKMESEKIARNIQQCFASVMDYYRNYGDSEVARGALRQVSEKAQCLDSMSKVIIAEKILSIAFAVESSPDVYALLKKVAIRFLESVLQNPITVDESYTRLPYMKGAIEEDKVRSRAETTLETCVRWL